MFGLSVLGSYRYHFVWTDNSSLNSTGYFIIHHFTFLHSLLWVGKRISNSFQFMLAQINVIFVYLPNAEQLAGRAYSTAGSFCGQMARISWNCTNWSLAHIGFTGGHSYNASDPAACPAPQDFAVFTGRLLALNVPKIANTPFSTWIDRFQRNSSEL